MEVSPTTALAAAPLVEGWNKIQDWWNDSFVPGWNDYWQNGFKTTPFYRIFHPDPQSEAVQTLDKIGDNFLGMLTGDNEREAAAEQFEREKELMELQRDLEVEANSSAQQRGVADLVKAADQSGISLWQLLGNYSPMQTSVSSGSASKRDTEQLLRLISTIATIFGIISKSRALSSVAAMNNAAKRDVASMYNTGRIDVANINNAGRIDAANVPRYSYVYTHRF